MTLYPQRAVYTTGTQEKQQIQNTTFQRQGWTSRLRQQTRLLRHIFEGVDGSTLM